MLPGERMGLALEGLHRVIFVIGQHNARSQADGEWPCGSGPARVRSASGRLAESVAFPGQNLVIVPHRRENPDGTTLTF